ncbi:glycosyltransferase [Salinibacter ruber]|uniref:glycosyltransferase n=1 Tax=Salinibacter ruber TaxID=146919 RepID=UPI002166F5FD|nr:glycosyltransferase [Salinibacter ruber]MCS4101411.1 glycosyltransferase involved in cell wall biosynthesis [Salinibacter ruber]
MDSLHYVRRFSKTSEIFIYEYVNGLENESCNVEVLTHYRENKKRDPLIKYMLLTPPVAGIPAGCGIGFEIEDEREPPELPFGRRRGNALRRLFEVWNRKKTAYQHASEQDQLHVVCPSEWMADEARASTLLADVPVSVIPYGLDTNRFFPCDAEGVPPAFGIPDDHRIVLFVASDTRARKGFDLLDNALSALGAEKTTLLSVGGDEPELESDLPHVHAGYVESDLLLSVLYSLADVFVIPSRQDNLPNTVLESMACGTPVIGFEVGGIPDMVRPGETGWLAEPEDVRSLREAIEASLSDDAVRRQRGERARAVVEKEYTLEVQARGYKDVYQRLLRE